MRGSNGPVVWQRALTAVAVAATLALAACGGGDKKDKPASQTAAKVNKEEITVHQINQVLATANRTLTPEQGERAGREALERLIDQELAVQKASELKLDRESRVVQQIETARREIIARAYLQKISEGASKPSADEIKKYYDEHPDLFSKRRIYQLQEIAVQATPDQVAVLEGKLKSGELKTASAVAEYLKAAGLKYGVNQGVRPAEQLPLQSLPMFSSMADGDVRVMRTPNGAQVLVLAGSRTQAVDLAAATPAIENFLLNDRRRKIIADDVKALRTNATIQYVGKYADKAADGASAPEASSPLASDAASAPAAAAATVEPATAPPAEVQPAAPAPAPSASAAAIDTNTINKGLGLK